MTTKLHSRRRNLCNLLLSAFVLFGFAASSFAQRPQPRISGEITSTQRVLLPHSQPPRAKFAEDLGALASSTRLGGMSLVFSRSAAQEADLKALIAAQQNPASPQYHAWLTPDQFAARFGMSDADLAKAQSWLEQQGFTVDSISRSRNRITFSGTSAQAQAAFGVQLHSYRANGKTHFAPSGDLSLPAALAPVVQAVTGLSSFRPRSHVRFRTPQLAPTANFTSSQTGTHYLTPADVDTIYDIKPAHDAGFTGSGQSIAVVGQSAVALTDIENFQRAAGLTQKDPTLVLMPNTGAATVYSDDESESDLDLEYSGAIAPGATIYFVYVGSNANDSVTDAIAYAVDNDIAPIISTSYGLCETELSAGSYNAENAVLEQAAAQGQTVIAAAGDSGSTDCFIGTSTADLNTLPLAQQEALAVDYPASSEYVTAMGGTEFPAAAVDSSNYWQSSNGSDVIGSALSYIPEQVWNDDSSSIGISAGGGGASIITPHPSWQTGVPGIPASPSHRLVPDIALDASPFNAGYLYCSSDNTSTGVAGSCANGFRDSSNTYLTIAGGTSFDAPIFAGMVAMINQATNSTGQGLVNPTLYTLAANPGTYASVFHDITSGTNACAAGSGYCSSAGESQFAAATGYDEATGLGSFDFNALLTAWKAAGASSTLLASTTTVTAAIATPASGTTDTITIAVASGSSTSSVTPTGSVTLVVDGTAASGTFTLNNGVATYTFSSSIAGSHIIRATYSGDSVYAPSTDTIVINVGGSTTPANSSFTLSATNVTVAPGASGTSTITITPSNGYTGTIGWTVSTSPASSAICYTVTNATVSSAAAVTTSLVVHTSSAACPNPSLIPGGAATTHALATSHNPTPPLKGTGQGTAPILAGAFLIGLCGIGSRSRKLRLFLALSVVSVAALSTFGCGSGTSSATANTTSATSGTYTVTITGTDVSSGKTASTTMTLTIQ